MNEGTMGSSSASGHWREYLILCKPKIVLLILFTAVVGMLLSVPAGMVPADAFLGGLLGIGLAASAAAVVNHLVDQRIDSVMARTRARPLPQGKIKPLHAVMFAAALAVLSLYVLAVWVNVLTAVLTLSSLVGYGFIYSMFLKRATPQNIVIGGAAGAAPPVLGWTAVTGSLDPQSLLLFLIIFAWTPPHFWALAVCRRKDYENAEIPMLPVTHGPRFTRLHILLYTIVLFLVCLLPYLVRMSGLIYLLGSVPLNAGFVYYAARMRSDGSDQLAMRTFRYSILHLNLLFAFLLVDHYFLILMI